MKERSAMAEIPNRTQQRSMEMLELLSQKSEGLFLHELAKELALPRLKMLTSMRESAKKKGLIYYINRIYENFRCLIFPRNAWIWPNQSWAKT